MSDRPTPETDAACIIAGCDGDGDCFLDENFCKRLERERNMALALYQTEQRLCKQYQDALDDIYKQIHALAVEAKRRGV